ncbi:MULTISPECIES: NADH-quinone oxidoreductase subunit C [Mycobacterium]|uniref:hydrogenase large subunit n=1 Tax=Mycobacterium TaxID=1763 RepID=UPI0003557299|nr:MULTISPECIES: NADH-quinone oxidoreductase subunit C [Mycobacterium]AGP66667.1 NADH-ubiquinone oxidoreductase, chain 49kDa [Mycobacterium intracellulare subsp. yongonense 05-1390]ARR80731.1 Ni,Fe-hydrogenase III large subunit [Mycobacterium intracellulare subsp. yongonense]ARR85789.1 NADH-ubiquinone oxidoreductase, chain 49kDa [Mycobacterium intracellulare subsp. yongonense]ASX02895.1 NADH-quinone oxidoreductase subunit D [Mycobacterium intracellulare subsp. chimaera]ETZ29976.1 respiratory-c
MTSAATTDAVDLPLERWRADVIEHVHAGCRFAAVYASHDVQTAQLHALLVGGARVSCLRTRLTPDSEGAMSYPSLTPDVPAAFWYERALHDLSGIVPIGHPRLDPLLLARQPGQPSPRPGYINHAALDHHVRSSAAEPRGPVDVGGGGIFTLPLGPVRSGVFESIEFLIETPGEDIPHLNIRPHYKHRGIAKRFETLPVADGILVAERVEGISSVAHALAFAHAVEDLTGATPPRRARLVRVIHAELERIANHLDVVTRLCDAAGLAVPLARFGWHKESTMRLVSALCGNRFGRSVVRVGGISAPPGLKPAELSTRLAAVVQKIRRDRDALMVDASFLDRLRGTGRLDPSLAVSHGALGPVGRASACDDDARKRPYDGYAELPVVDGAVVDDRGDALARLRVRWGEIDIAAELIRRACDRLSPIAETAILAPVEAVDGFALGWAEAAQGEVLYGLEVREGMIRRCFARSASLHNMLLFHDVFGGDIFTDFPFIEASFGLCYAGVAM